MVFQAGQIVALLGGVREIECTFVRYEPGNNTAVVIKPDGVHITVHVDDLDCTEQGAAHGLGGGEPDLFVNPQSGACIFCETTMEHKPCCTHKEMPSGALAGLDDAHLVRLERHMYWAGVRVNQSIEWLHAAVKTNNVCPDVFRSHMRCHKGNKTWAKYVHGLVLGEIKERGITLKKRGER